MGKKLKTVIKTERKTDVLKARTKKKRRKMGGRGRRIVRKIGLRKFINRLALAEAKGVEKRDKRFLQFTASQILVFLCPNSSL
jgi:hypothetical protein